MAAPYGAAGPRTNPARQRAAGWFESTPGCLGQPADGESSARRRPTKRPEAPPETRTPERGSASARYYLSKTGI